MEIAESVSKVIKNLRLNKLWTQQDLANRLYVTRQCISKWETGIVVPDITSLERISKVFDVEVENFFKDNNENDKEILLKETEIDPSNYKIIKEREKRSIRNYIFVACLNILYAFLTVLMFIFKVPFIYCLLVDLFLLVSSTVVFTKSDTEDLKTDDSAIYYKTALMSFVINFAIVLSVFAIAYSFFPVHFSHAPAALIIVFLFYYINKKDKIGIFFSSILTLLIYGFGFGGSFSYVVFGLLAIINIFLMIILFKNYHQNKKDLWLSIILILISFYTLIFKNYQLRDIRKILEIVYFAITLFSLILFLFWKNKKYILFGFILYIIFNINRYMGYLMHFGFDRSLLSFQTATFAMYLGTIGFYLMIIYWLSELYKKYKKGIIVIGIFVSMMLIEITMVLGIKIEIPNLITYEYNFLEITSYVRMICYCVVLLVYFGIVLIIDKKIRTKKVIGILIIILSLTVSIVYKGEKSFSNIEITKGINDIELISTFAKFECKDNNKLLILYNGAAYDISDYDFYLIVNDNKEESYYIADTLKNNQKEGIVSLTIIKTDNYINNAFSSLAMDCEYTINTQIYKDNENQFLTLNSFASEKNLEKIFSNSKELKMVDDEILERLKITQNFYTYFQDLEYINNDLENKSYAFLNQVEYIPNTNNDFYTNEDGIIFEYIDSYFGNILTPEGDITDDPIVQVIPKNIFFELGRHLHIGKEYGFFVEVSIDSLIRTDYKVEVLVFDICFEEPSSSLIQGRLKIAPIFQKVYRAVDKNKRNNVWNDFDDSKDQIVFPHIQHNLSNLYLYDIAIKKTIENSISSNIGDEGYINLNDNGNYFQQMRLNCAGIGIIKNNCKFENNTMDFAFGFRIPGAIGYKVDSTEGLISEDDSYYQEKYASNNKLNIQTCYPNFYDQCTYYGNPIKTINISLKKEASKKMLYNVGGYFEVISGVSRKDGKSNVTKTTYSIALGVCRDYSGKLLGLGYGDIVNLVYGERTISNSKKKELNFDETISDWIYSDDYHNIYEIIASETSSYTINVTKISNLNITLFNSDEEEITVDINSGESGTGFITYNFKKDEKYYLKIDSDNYIGSYDIGMFKVGL